MRSDTHRTLRAVAAGSSVNRSSHDMTMNSDAFWKPHLPCQCDPCHFLLGLIEAVTAAGAQRWDEWAAGLKQAEVKKEAANARVAAKVARGRDGTPLQNPLALLNAMEATMSEDSILVADGGDFVGTASYIVRPRGPLRWLDPGAFGTLGVGGGFALGAKLCR